MYSSLIWINLPTTELDSVINYTFKHYQLEEMHLYAEFHNYYLSSYVTHAQPLPWHSSNCACAVVEMGNSVNFLSCNYWDNKSSALIDLWNVMAYGPLSHQLQTHSM